MSNYKSKHTGAQVDEAVSKVLNGEVGGGATGANPDWNAQNGEDGYIKNRTHYIVWQGNVENRDSSGDDITVYASIDITGQKTPVIIFKQPFINNDNTISDMYGDGDLSNILHVVKGNSILKRFDKSTSGDYDPYFARVTIEDTTIDTYDETTILRVSIRINTSEEGYGIDAAEVVGSVYQGIAIPLNDVFIPDTIARKSDLENLSNGSTGKSKFQLYQENGGRFFTNENLYNIFDALRNECSDYYWDFEIYTPLESGHTYTFGDLDITYWNFIGVIYGSNSASVMINDDDTITLHRIGESTDEYLWFESENAQLRVDLVAKTVEFDYNVSD